MQDMLKKIIEIDKKAREIKQKAVMEKTTTENEIANTKKEIYDDYLNRAKIRVATNLKADREEAEKGWEITKKKNEAAMKKLVESYENNHDKWSDEIVKRVIG